MENTPATQNATNVTIATNVEIDMPKIVSVGVAKMEKRIAKKIAELQSDHKAVVSQITDKNKEMDDLCKATTPDSFSAFEAGVKLFPDKKFYLDVQTQLRVQQKLNNHCLTLNNSSHGNQGLVLKNAAIPYTDDQETLHEKIQDLTSDASELLQKIVELKQKLSDVPKLERQMQARVVEKQLEQTSEGQQVLDSIMEQFDEDFDFIG